MAISETKGFLVLTALNEYNLTAEEHSMTATWTYNWVACSFTLKTRS